MGIIFYKKRGPILDSKIIAVLSFVEHILEFKICSKSIKKRRREKNPLGSVLASVLGHPFRPPRPPNGWGTDGERSLLGFQNVQMLVLRGLSGLLYDANDSNRRRYVLEPSGALFGGRLYHLFGSPHDYVDSLLHLRRARAAGWQVFMYPPVTIGDTSAGARV